MITARHIIGFSGHRQLADAPAVRSAIFTTLKDLQQRAASRGAQAELFTSAAAGADLLALDCARELHMPIHLLLPMSEGEFSRDFQYPDEWARAQAFIESAKRGENGGSFRTLRLHQERDVSYYALLVRLVEAADLILVVWDGKAGNGLGGTADFVELAGARQKPLLRIPTEAPAPAALDSLPADWPAPDDRIAELNEILHESTPFTKAADLQAALGRVANEKAPAFRRDIARTIRLHAIAALFGAIPSLFYLALVPVSKEANPVQWAQWNYLAKVFIGAEFLCVVLSLVLTLRLYWGRVRKKWIESRFATEILRSVRASRPWLDPLHPEMGRAFPSWRRFLVTGALMAHAEALPGHSFEEKKEVYLAGRLEDQRTHFIQQAATAIRRHRFWTRLAKGSAILSPFFVLFALLNQLFDANLTENWPGALFGKFLPVALPLIAGTAMALRSALDLNRRAIRYPEMAARLATTAQSFRQLKTVHAATAAVSRSEEMLTTELLEWRVATQHAGSR